MVNVVLPLVVSGIVPRFTHGMNVRMCRSQDFRDTTDVPRRAASCFTSPPT
jgi:hypothetical protein